MVLPCYIVVSISSASFELGSTLHHCLYLETPKIDRQVQVEDFLYPRVNVYSIGQLNTVIALIILKGVGSVNDYIEVGKGSYLSNRWPQGPFLVCSLP